MAASIMADPKSTQQYCTQALLCPNAKFPCSMMTVLPRPECRVCHPQGSWYHTSLSFSLQLQRCLQPQWQSNWHEK